MNGARSVLSKDIGAQEHGSTCFSRLTGPFTCCKSNIPTIVLISDGMFEMNITDAAYTGFDGTNDLNT